MKKNEIFGKFVIFFYNCKKKTNWKAVSNLINDCFMYINKDDDNSMSFIVYDYLDKLDNIVDNEINGLKAVG